MELVLVGSGPWKRVVQPWSWGNSAVKWCDRFTVFLGTPKKLCVDILWHIQIWVAEKLLTSLDETRNEASKRSKEKITRLNMTCMTLHDTVWKVNLFGLCQIHSRQEPQFSDVAAVPGSWSWSLWQLNHHLYKDLYITCVFQDFRISCIFCLLLPRLWSLEHRLQPDLWRTRSISLELSNLFSLLLPAN